MNEMLTPFSIKLPFIKANHVMSSASGSIDIAYKRWHRSWTSFISKFPRTVELRAISAWLPASMICYNSSILSFWFLFGCHPSS
ncbi:hypothetical protein BJX76DRAFT_269455 [Aspergillus varians]